jgi:hypothetical protein
MALPSEHISPRPAHDRVDLLLPLIVLAWTSTAVPVELRPFDWSLLTWQADPWDVFFNVVGFIPLGLALTRWGLLRGVGIAALLSGGAEISQFFMMHRHPSVPDWALNTAGAAIGLLAGLAWRIDRLTVVASARTAGLSLLGALVLVGYIGWSNWDKLWQREGSLIVSGRGAISPGCLEAYWTFDEGPAGSVFDESGSGHHGVVWGAARDEGIHGLAMSFVGDYSHIDFGSPVALRLMGSLTICAWIKAASFPDVDTAIVSSHVPGYQLDTTTDTGPRTIGFKLIDPCDNLMIRYGATALTTGAWYHLAGVYDADAQTLDVYLNGQLDNGEFLGKVAWAQHASEQPIYIGWRPDTGNSPFAGLIDDVAIYSRALTAAEIQSTMSGVSSSGQSLTPLKLTTADEILALRKKGRRDECHRSTRLGDSAWPGLAASLGTMAALFCAGLWPRRTSLMVGAGLAAGLFMLPAAVMILPRYDLWMIPLLAALGGAAVAVSIAPAGAQLNASRH